MDFDLSTPMRAIFALVLVVGLIGLVVWLVRRFSGERLGNATARGRQPRLAVIDAAAVDGRRRLVLIRRDNVEHLLMIGGPTDVVVELNIVRAAPAREPNRRGRPRQPSRFPGRLRSAKEACGRCSRSRQQGPSRQRARSRSESASRHHDPSPRRGRSVRRRSPRTRRNGRSPRPLRHRASAGRERPTRWLGWRRNWPARRRRKRIGRAARAPGAAPGPARAAPATRTAAACSAAGSRAAVRPAADQNLAEMAQRLEAALRRPPRSDDGRAAPAARAQPAAAEADSEPAPPSPTASRHVRRAQRRDPRASRARRHRQSRSTTAWSRRWRACWGVLTASLDRSQ